MGNICCFSGSRRGNRILPTNSTVLALGLDNKDLVSYRRHRKKDDVEIGCPVAASTSKSMFACTDKIEVVIFILSSETQYTIICATVAHRQIVNKLQQSSLYVCVRVINQSIILWKQHVNLSSQTFRQNFHKTKTT